MLLFDNWLDKDRVQKERILLLLLFEMEYSPRVDETETICQQSYWIYHILLKTQEVETSMYFNLI